MCSIASRMVMFRRVWCSSSRRVERGQATLYAIRHRRRMRGTRPSVWMVASSVVDVLIAAGLAIGGIAMRALPPELAGGVLAATVVFAFILAVGKIPVFAHL